MTCLTSSRISVALAFALGAFGPTTPPAAAQGAVAMPTIAYPAAGTRWGCHFTTSCLAAAAPATRWIGASTPGAPAAAPGAAAGPVAPVPAASAGSPPFVVRR